MVTDKLLYLLMNYLQTVEARAKGDESSKGSGGGVAVAVSLGVDGMKGPTQNLSSDSLIQLKALLLKLEGLDPNIFTLSDLTAQEQQLLDDLAFSYSTQDGEDGEGEENTTPQILEVQAIVAPEGPLTQLDITYVDNNIRFHFFSSMADEFAEGDDSSSLLADLFNLAQKFLDLNFAFKGDGNGVVGSGVTFELNFEDGQRFLNLLEGAGRFDDNFQSNINLPPVLNLAGLIAFLQSNAFYIGTLANLNIAGFVSDPEGQPLNFSAAGLPNGVTMSSAGLIVGTPLTTPLGGPEGTTEFFTLTVTDPQGNVTTVSVPFIIFNNYVFDYLDTVSRPTVILDIVDSNFPIYIKNLPSGNGSVGDLKDVIIVFSDSGRLQLEMINPDSNISFGRVDLNSAPANLDKTDGVLVLDGVPHTVFLGKNLQDFNTITLSQDIILLSESRDVIGDSNDQYIQGSFNTDGIDAGGGDDIVSARDGNDLIRGGLGNDFLDGGDDSDIAFYSHVLVDSNNISHKGLNYTFALGATPGDITITDVSGQAIDDGTDTLRNIEYLTFDDGVTIISYRLFVGDDGAAPLGVLGDSNDPSHQLVLMFDNPTVDFDVANTGAGDDVIIAGDGKFDINAGDGANKVTLGNGYGLVTTGAGKDLITTGDGDISIDAGDGDNTITTGDGSANIISGSGNDTIKTGTGAYTIMAGDGENNIEVEETTSGSVTVITTGAGDDTIKTGNGRYNISAEDGLNIIEVGDNTDPNGATAILTGTGNDVITVGSGVIFVTPGAGDNEVHINGTGNVGLTYSFGEGGEDHIQGFATADSASDADRLLIETTAAITPPANFSDIFKVITFTATDHLIWNFDQDEDGFDAEDKLVHLDGIAPDLNGVVISMGFDVTNFVAQVFSHNAEMIDLNSNPQIATAFTFTLDGDDSIIGTSGNDFIDGGDDIDTVHFTKTFNGNYSIALVDPNNLAAGYVVTDLTGSDGTDTLRNIEFLDFNGEIFHLVLGTPGDDDPLNGTPDDDLIVGLDGDDNVKGDAGDDFIDGGAGTDTARYYHLLADPSNLPNNDRGINYTFALGAVAGDITITDASGLSPDDGTDTLRNIEYLTFDDDSLVPVTYRLHIGDNDAAAQGTLGAGSNNENQLILMFDNNTNNKDYAASGSGDDVIIGGDGWFEINAGAGNNTVVIGNNPNINPSLITTLGGNDRITVGDGFYIINPGAGDNDIIIGGQGNVRVTYNWSEGGTDHIQGFGAVDDADGADSIGIQQIPSILSPAQLLKLMQFTIDSGVYKLTMDQNIDGAFTPGDRVVYFDDVDLNPNGSTGVGIQIYYGLTFQTIAVNLLNNSDDNLDFSSQLINPLYLYALGGNDTIKGTSRDDFIDGGDGNDTVRYTNSFVDNYTITLLLNSNNPSEGFNVTDLSNSSVDTLRSIEKLEFGGILYNLILGANGNDGSAFGSNTADLFVMFGGNDNASGLGGNDIILLGDGDDVAAGGSGNDFIDGGDGTDRANYGNPLLDPLNPSNDRGINYTFALGNAYTDSNGNTAYEVIITDSSGSDTDGTDTLRNVEVLRFSGGVDYTLAAGDNGAGSLGNFASAEKQLILLFNNNTGSADNSFGGSGDDVIIAGNGFFNINAGNGNNTIVAGNSTVGFESLINAGDGNDRITVGDGSYTIAPRAGDNTVNLLGDGQVTIEYGANEAGTDHIQGFGTADLGSDADRIHFIANFADLSAFFDHIQFSNDPTTTHIIVQYDQDSNGFGATDKFIHLDGVVPAGNPAGIRIELQYNDLSNGVQAVTAVLLNNSHNIVDLSGLSNPAYVLANLGDDIIKGSAFNDLIDGGFGFDRVLYSDSLFNATTHEFNYSFALSGMDLLITTPNEGTDTLRGIDQLNLGGFIFNLFPLTNGDDSSVLGSASSDLILGFDGNDTVDAALHNDVVLLGNGNDTAAGGAGNDYIDGGAGNDTANYSHLLVNSANTANKGLNYTFALGSTPGSLSITDVSGASPNDGTDTLLNIESLNFAGVTYRLFVGDNNVNNFTNGSLHSNQLVLLFDSAGLDSAVTGNGDDVILSGNGNAFINAGGGNNLIIAGDGNKTILSSSGDDTITVGNGTFTISDNGGNNTIVVGNSTDPTTASTILTGAGVDNITIGTGLFTIAPGAGDNTVTMNGVNNVTVKYYFFRTGTDHLSTFGRVGSALGTDVISIDDSVTGSPTMTTNIDVLKHLSFSFDNTGGSHYVLTFDSNNDGLFNSSDKVIHLDGFALDGNGVDIQLQRNNDPNLFTATLYNGANNTINTNTANNNIFSLGGFDTFNFGVEAHGTTINYFDGGIESDILNIDLTGADINASQLAALQAQITAYNNAGSKTPLTLTLDQTQLTIVNIENVNFTGQTIYSNVFDTVIDSAFMRYLTNQPTGTGDVNVLHMVYGSGQTPTTNPNVLGDMLDFDIVSYAGDNRYQMVLNDGSIFGQAIFTNIAISILNSTVPLQFALDSNNNGIIDGNEGGSGLVNVALANDSNNSFTLSSSQSIAFGLDGNDVIIGRDLLRDYIDGGAGNDTLYGDRTTFNLNNNNYTAGSDYLHGGAGENTLYGDLNLLRINTNNITFTGGNDFLYGGVDKDIIYGDASSVNFSANATTFRGGNDYLEGGAANDTLYGDTDTVIFNGSNRSFVGGNDFLYGGDGEDTLCGDARLITFPNNGSGSNRFFTAGQDTLDGGKGNDELYGDWLSTTGFGNLTAGQDTFVFNLSNGGDGFDTIRDFNVDGVSDILKFTGVTDRNNNGQINLLDILLTVTGSSGNGNAGNAVLRFDLDGDTQYDDASITFTNINYTSGMTLTDILNSNGANGQVMVTA